MQSVREEQERKERLALKQKPSKKKGYVPKPERKESYVKTPEEQQRVADRNAGRRERRAVKRSECGSC